MISTTNAKIKIHYSLIIFTILSLFLGQGQYVLLFLGIVFLHELGHIISLLIFKGHIEGLTITIVGGIVDINDSHLSAWQKLVVNLSGVLMNGLLIVIASRTKIPAELQSVIISYNKLMIAFNLLPIYPLDGSRIIEVFLNWFFDFEYATVVSGQISTIFLVILTIYGMISQSGAIIIISIFLFLKMIERRQVLRLSVVRHSVYNYALLKQIKGSL